MRFRKPTLYKKRKTRIIRNKRIQTPNKRIQTRNKRIKTRRKIRHYILGGAGEDETNVSPERDKKNSKENLQNISEFVENENRSFLVAATQTLPQFKRDFSFNTVYLQSVKNEKKPSLLAFNFEANKKARITDIEFKIDRNKNFFNVVVDELKGEKQELLDRTDNCIKRLEMFESNISDENPFISKITTLQDQRKQIASIDFGNPQYSKID